MLKKILNKSKSKIKNAWRYLNKSISTIPKIKHGKLQLRNSLQNLLFFILGTITSPFIIENFAKSITPDVPIDAYIIGFIPPKSQEGCILYGLQIYVKDPVDYLYVKFQFPYKINDNQIGIPLTGFNPEGNTFWGQAWVTRKENNTCLIREPAQMSLGSLQIDPIGNVLTIQASRLQEKYVILGLISVNKEESFLNPNPDFFSKGLYEVSTLGITVEKSFDVKNKGFKVLESK